MGNLINRTSRQTMMSLTAWLLAMTPQVAPPASAAGREAVIHFNRDIRPILADNCYHCHGPDEKTRKAGLHLHTREGATNDLGGYAAIVPGQPDQSALIKRLLTDDPDDLMPPPATGKKLGAAQIQLLKDWIAAGADYQPHWAFLPPNPPPVPKVKNGKWARQPLDAFVAAALEQKKLKPSPEAPKETLIRRVKLDLTGLPPTLEEIDEFLADRRPDAYERLVDRFMARPAYGEHQARYWLDAVRYGDTHGLHLDNERSIWPYRDWVVRAFNENKPFDQFTIEQIAGDLLPNATRDQQVASGFNRCNVTTSEGGAIDEEFYVRYAVDRTEAVGTVWMGLTLGCAVCHDHKFDPVSQKEFFRLYAFFASAADKAMDGNALLPAPILKLPSPGQEREMDELNGKIGPLEKKIKDTLAGIQYTDPAADTNRGHSKPVEFIWVEDDFPPETKPSTAASQPQWLTKDQGPVYSGDRAWRLSATNQVQVQFLATNAVTLGPAARLFVHVHLDPAHSSKALALQLHAQGWKHWAIWGESTNLVIPDEKQVAKYKAGPLPKAGQWVKLEVEAARLGLRSGAKISGLAFTQNSGVVHWDRAGISSSPDEADDPAKSLLAWAKESKMLDGKAGLPKEILDVVKTDAAKRKDDQKKKLRDYYLENAHAGSRPLFEPLHKELNPLKERRAKLEGQIPATMVMKEAEKPREAYVLIRGQYDQRGEKVTPGVPAALPPLPAGRTTNRLDLARWLVSPNHPLTARVTVNRFWQQFFGQGLVKTANDFGVQGAWPTHPELLDWLASEFAASGWDIKKFQRMLVTSAAYRQSSVVSQKLLQADPENLWLARGPRFRLDGEIIRDQALSVSGLLNPAMGGRGFRPYQPPGIWEAVGYTTSNTAKYQPDKGDSIYRRSLYLFWKRTAPPPMMTTLDAPSREAPCVRRERTNTPQQALLLLNDTAFVEAARHLASRMISQGGATPADRLRYGFRLVTARPPASRELGILKQSLENHLARYQQKPEAAKSLIAIGDSPVPASLNPAELAAYTMVANLLLNLDETLTKN